MGRAALPRQAELVSSEPLVVPTGHYINLIHVDDAATSVLAAELVRFRIGVATLRMPARSSAAIPDRNGETTRASAARVPRTACSRSGELRGGNKRVSNRRMLEDCK